MYQGCCDGKKVVYCNFGALTEESCGGDTCGWDGSVYSCGPHVEEPSGQYPYDCHNYDYPVGCGEKECGDNGAGYSCGQCEGEQECVDGICETGCVPACEAKECGEDGCDGLCGECGAGEECSTHSKCEPVCTPDCTDKTCGDDGCQGTCGECGEDEACAEWQCVSINDTDIKSEDTGGSEEDVAAQDVAPFKPDLTDSEDDGGGSGGGCSHTGTSGPAAPLVLLMLVGTFVTLRRREDTRS